jgi:NDP-sugar pyrophosphorylase family protein
MDLGRNFQSGILHTGAPGPSGLHGVRALVLVGGRPSIERFGDVPLALLDVLGRSVLMRTLDRLRAANVGEIAVVTDTALPPGRALLDSCKFSVAPERFWEESLQQFRRLSRHSECVLVLRLGAWAELNFAAFVNQHRQSGSATVRAHAPAGQALDFFVISSANQAEAAALLRGELRDERIDAAAHCVDGYVNLLATPRDLRTLTLDAFAGECEIQPCGRELRPGVWVGRGARIHRHARIVAPAFIGQCCNVRRAAVVTRGSSLERHSEIDCATVIENSNVMPYTRIGAGLDVEYSVVGFHRVYSLSRSATVEIEDPYLLAAATTQISAGIFAALSWLLTFLNSFGSQSLPEPEAEPTLSAATDALSPIPVLSDASLASVEPQTKSYREMAAVRRYGNE